MKRLEYPHYIASNAGPAAASPAEIDWKLAKHLSTHYSESCLGVHFISPPLSAPKLQESPVEWVKWTIANSVRSPMLGYSKDDFSALHRTSQPSIGLSKTFSPMTEVESGDWEPNTLSYALCDSPIGLLLYVLKMLRILHPKKELTPAEIITLTALVWLPGPEAALRFWARCSALVDKEATKKPTVKPKVAVTVFLGDEETTSEEQSEEAALPRPAKHAYACPAWALPRFDVVSSNRVAGTPGFLGWDRPEVIIEGARGLAKAILATDKRMQSAEQPGVALLEQVVVEGGRTAPADLSGTTVQETAETTGESAKGKGKQVESPGQKTDTTFLAPPPVTTHRASTQSGGSSGQASA